MQKRVVRVVVCLGLLPCSSRFGVPHAADVRVLLPAAIKLSAHVVYRFFNGRLRLSLDKPATSLEQQSTQPTETAADGWPAF